MIILKKLNKKDMYKFIELFIINLFKKKKEIGDKKFNISYTIDSESFNVHVVTVFAKNEKHATKKFWLFHDRTVCDIEDIEDITKDIIINTYCITYIYNGNLLDVFTTNFRTVNKNLAIKEFWKDFDGLLYDIINVTKKCNQL